MSVTEPRGRSGGGRVSVWDDCGTYGAWNRHMRHGVPVCDPCRDAQRRYTRDWRMRKASKRAYSYPVELPPCARAGDTFGLGHAIAVAVRWSA